MVIDFVFEKDINPWDEIEIRKDKNTKSINLKKKSLNTRSLEILGTDDICFIKRNIWEDGIEEILFSIDGTFHNTFSSGNLPYSLKISVKCDTENKIIHIPHDVILQTDEKS